MKNLIDKNTFIFSEAAIIERLRRRSDVRLDDALAHAPLIYNASESDPLSEIYVEYINTARKINVPILICTPTWRTNQERVDLSNKSPSINIDAARYLAQLRESIGDGADSIKIGGLIGCKNDCYKPEEGLSTLDAQRFHSWQIDQLVDGGVDFLIAVTLPNVDEALGIAKAMEKSGKPYILSFVIGKDGKVLDGKTLDEAFHYIDLNTENLPLGYFVNCSYPSFLNPSKQPKDIFKRLIGIQANASSLDHCELEGSPDVKSESVKEWAALMLELNKKYGVKVLGGCCGTNNEHLESIASQMSVAR